MNPDQVDQGFPALNNITAPFLFLINNDFIIPKHKDELKQTTEELLADLDNSRLNYVSKNIDLFTEATPVRVPSDFNINDFIEKEAKEGILYEFDLTAFKDLGKRPIADMYEFMLFLDTTRDGMRLVVPIYKLFMLSEDELWFTPMGCVTSMVIEPQADDKFLLTRGDTLRGCVKKLKKQNKYQTCVVHEHAGISGKFSDTLI